MNPKLIPILERIIARETILQSFHADNLPQSALAYVRHTYAMCRSLSWEEQDLIETLPPFADNISESFREGSGGDASIYHLFDDGSLWIKTNAYQQIWADARDFAVESILPLMRLDRMDADLLRAIGMDDHVDEVRDDFFGAFAHVLHRDCGIPHCDARERWYQFCQSSRESDRLELGGYRQGETEAREYLEWIKTIA
jgi:hypothetical protein